MDLSTLSDAQACVVNTLPGPLFVSAGAGSGKTFTLKLRTAQALLPNESGFKLDSIEEVLAITFTEKAAAELLSRIKGTLLEEGLVEQALLADNAWISTIHGMASRLLRENALEIGLDPEFALISEVDAADLREQARMRVIEQVRSGAIDLGHIAWNQELFARGAYGRGLMDDAQVLTSKAGAMPHGFEGVVSFEGALTPHEAIERMVVLARQFVELASRWDRVHQRNEQPYLDMMEEALPQAEAWLESDDSSCGFADDDFDPMAFREVLFAFPAPSPSFGKKKEGEEFFAEYRREYAKIGVEVDGILGGQATKVVQQIAELITDEYGALKRAANVIDNDDMLSLCLAALEEHPLLAERYRQKFKLIMIDEFQDTDKVQIEIIRHLAAPDFANVCVVGDAQQSIYRFRGADVDAFIDYRDALLATAEREATYDEEALFPKLDDNHRSHADILAFVDSIFKQEQAFGSDYLKLNPKGKINENEDPAMDARSRIAVDVIHYAKGGSGASKQAALERSAADIAHHFAEIRRAYSEAGSDESECPHTYALLLGVTRNAQIYIDALRREGFESMMTSGSVLACSQEAKTIAALVRYALNTNDDQALLDILTSSLFAISDDALVALSYYEQDGRLHHGSLSGGFRTFAEDEEGRLSAEEVQAVVVAQTTLRRFVRAARVGAPSEAVRRLLVESGILDRERERGVDGLAVVGNLSKTLDMLTSAEEGCAGIAETVRAFEAKLAHANESPGVLSVENPDFVQIMTIHGSKGLQFDHVAVADIKVANRFSTRGFVAENAGEGTFAMAYRGLDRPKYLKDAFAEDKEEGLFADPREARTPGELFVTLEHVAQTAEMAEARRLLYVALTRAVRSLFVSYVTNTSPNPKKGEPYASDGIFRDVHRALGWATDATSLHDVSNCTYGGARAAEVTFAVIDEDDAMAPDEVNGVVEETERDDDAPEGLAADALADLASTPSAPTGQPFKVPLRPQVPPLTLVAPPSQRANVFSYSSLSSGAHASAPASLALEEMEEPSFLVREVGEDATALGTAFHHLAQLAIIERARRGGGALVCPSEEHIEAQIDKLDLSSGQIIRLRQALENWFASDVAACFAQHDDISAEVPFMVRIEGSDQPFFLEGEIDALATDGEGHAFLIDYKTGGSDSESADVIHAKHLMQAQCYAYALMRNGFEGVEATFVRVEHALASSDTQSAPSLQTVVYAFSREDLNALESMIDEARLSS